LGSHKLTIPKEVTIAELPGTRFFVAGLGEGKMTIYFPEIDDVVVFLLVVAG